MNFRRKLERLERRARDAICSVCKNDGGRRMSIAWPGEPVDLSAETACQACGRCPPVEQAKVIDVGDVVNLGFNPYELAVAKHRITGKITPAEGDQLRILEAHYATTSALPRGVA